MGLANRVHSTLRNTPCWLRIGVLTVACVAIGSVLPDADHLWGGRSFLHSDATLWAIAGLLGVGLSMFIAGMALAYYGRQNEHGVLK